MEPERRCVRSSRLTHAQIETLYHELFHAYLDYLVTEAEASPETAWDPVLAFARVQQGCHYGAVLITPVAAERRRHGGTVSE